MNKKYFTAFCVMNSADLRANLLHHGCLIFLEADCSELGQLQPPLNVVNAYGFYSHLIPTRPSIFTPSTFFAYLAGFPRISGSYGEWRRENIHDLALGRGLSGRLFEMRDTQFHDTQHCIQSIISSQENFFAGKTSIQEKEDYYRECIDKLIEELIDYQSEPEQAEEKATQQLPIKQFNISNTCKVAALELLEASYKRPTKKLSEYVALLKGQGIAEIIPRLTEGLDQIIIHANTQKWCVKGRQSKHPYYDWNDAKQDPDFHMYAVDFGTYYINKHGNPRSVSSLSEADKTLICNLKTIGRICEINLDDSYFKSLHTTISRIVWKISVSKNNNERKSHLHAAAKILADTLNDRTFKEKTRSNLPAYLSAELHYLATKENTPDHEDLDEPYGMSYSIL